MEPVEPVLAIGTAALDIKSRLARAPLPTTDVPGRITIKAGGVARNIAENFVRLSVPVVFAGIMGDDPQARLLIDLSRTAGLDVQPLSRSAHAPDDWVRLKLPAVLPTATLNVVLGRMAVKSPERSVVTFWMRCSRMIWMACTI